MRGVAIVAGVIAAVVALVAGCGGKESDLESQLKTDVQARGLEATDVSCKKAGPKFDCKVTFGDESEADYDVVQCGPRYDARAKPPATPAARSFHFGGDCEPEKYVPQRQVALAVVRTQSRTGCEKYWEGLAANCRIYLNQASPHSDARVDYVQPRPDGTLEVALTDPEGPAGLAVRVKEKDGKPVVAGLVNFEP